MNAVTTNGSLDKALEHVFPNAVQVEQEIEVVSLVGRVVVAGARIGPDLIEAVRPDSVHGVGGVAEQGPVLAGRIAVPRLQVVVAGRIVHVADVRAAAA